jgi:anthranilate phosphoribosyltransferase
VSITQQIDIIQLGRSLNRHEVSETMLQLLSGDFQPDEAALWLRTMEAKPITATELAAARCAVMAKALPFQGVEGALDCCGTGGDGAHTLNISTATAFVVAACGVPVIKHGNRAVSSSTGSSDVLGALGIAHDTPNDILAKQAQQGLAFLYAPAFHPGLKRVAALRKSIKTRTVFNLLGPLCNPARPEFQLMGVYDAALLPLVAETMKKIGVRRAMVVHSDDGLDELSISAPTHSYQLSDSEITQRIITPEDAGLTRHPARAIQGGDAGHNAAALRALLQGKPGAYRDAVLLNAAACLEIACKASSLKEGVALAAKAIDSGAAHRQLTERSNHD